LSFHLFKTIHKHNLPFGALLLLMLITSCYSAKKLLNKSETPVVNFSAAKLNGIYKNQIKDFDNFGLWQLFYRSKSFINDTISTVNTAVKLNMLTAKQLEVQLLSNGKIIRMAILKGHIKNGYFSVNKKLVYLPIPFLYKHQESKILVGNDNSGNLVVIHAFKDEDWQIIMAGGGGGGISNYTFERIGN